MKIKENVTLYQCDFCKKELKRKHAMIEHEKFCNNNPENHKICLSGCSHLTNENIFVTYEKGYDFINSETLYEDRKVNCFKCNKLDKLMYPYSIEKSIALEKYPETFEYQEPMPKECEHFNDDVFNFLD